MKICPACMGGSIGYPRVCAECGADLSESPDRKGTQLEGLVVERKVKLVEFIGEGAMGWVYRGQHLNLDSSVAVKLMKPTGDPDGSDINDRRFAQEARSASRLNSPHVISIMDFGRTPGGLLFIVSEFLRGFTLTDLLTEHGAMPVGRALSIADQILQGLEEAHAAGLIHRDMKPDNIMITSLRSGEDFVKILDFGIAKLSGPGDGARLTQQGQVIGTPTYMSPEQIRGRDVRETADLYSLGAMLFEMLTGRPPFDSESVMEVLAMHLSTPPPRLREVAPERALPEALEAVLLRTLAKPAEERFQSAGELRRALASIAIEEARRDASCPTCGAYITPNARFCASCGASTSLLSDPCDAAESQRNRRATAETALQVGAPTPPRQSRSSSPLATGERAASGELPSTTLNRRLRVEQTRRFALTGREEELGRLAAFLNGAEGALEILGPIGSGRTRLLAEAKELAARLGVEARQANPDPTLARRPWEPVQRLVSSTLGLGPRPGQHAIRASLAQAGLPPEDLLGLSELFELRDPDACLEHAVRLRETKAAAMRAICSRADDARPLLVTVDDADELDPASRSVFLDLAAMADGRRLKVLLVAERSLLPPGQRPPPIEPRPLTRKEISDLWDVLDGRPTDTEADRLRIIAERSEGLPLHVIQAMRLLCEGGSEVDVPLGELVQTRVRRLPTEALRLLQTLSVIGVRAKLERVASLLDQKPDRFRGALQLLAKRDLVSESPEGELLITHPRIGEIVREAIPADARRRQHRALLEELRAAGEPPVALARHALEARLGEEALQLLLAAGAQAELSLDDAGAVVHFKRALQVARWELLLDERDPTCLDLSLRLGEALRYSGDLLGAQMVLGELVQSASGHPATRARALRALALLLQARGDPATALETMQQAVREAFFASDPTLLNQIYMDLGRVLELSGDGERALQELSEGVLMVTNGDGAEAPQAPDSFWRLLGQISELYFRKGELTAALQSAHAALWQAERAGSKVGAARCNFLLGRCYDRLGVIEEAEKHHAMALETFRQLGDRRSAAEVLLSGASYYPTEKEDLLSQAQGLLGQLQWRPDAKHLPS